MFPQSLFLHESRNYKRSPNRNAVHGFADKNAHASTAQGMQNRSLLPCAFARRIHDNFAWPLVYETREIDRRLSQFSLFNWER